MFFYCSFVAIELLVDIEFDYVLISEVGFFKIWQNFIYCNWIIGWILIWLCFNFLVMFEFDNN